MRGEFQGLPVRMVQLGRDLFALTGPIVYIRPNALEVHINLLHRGSDVLGFVTDGGTKPAIFTVLIGSHTDEGFPAYVLHDWLYRHRIYGDTPQGRAEADRVLLEALETCGVGRLKRQLIYRVVRAFGWHWWNRQPAVDLGRITAGATTSDYYLLPTGYPEPLRFRILTLRDKSGTN